MCVGWGDRMGWEEEGKQHFADNLLILHVDPLDGSFITSISIFHYVETKVYYPGPLAKVNSVRSAVLHDLEQEGKVPGST